MTNPVILIFYVSICAFSSLNFGVILCISLDEKNDLKNQAKEMFYHAYHAYMDNAYPADELMPLSCKGRYRDVEPNRGDVDDALGNFSLTLVDTLDTLVVLGDFDEFEVAVKKVIRDVSFNNDVVVSVFETNIRMMGGLLSGHILSSYLQEQMNRMKWYHGELLHLAQDLGYRLLPAFNTSTGVPHPRINLRYGLKSPKLGVVRETCTACAGTMILEFAALSRLTGEPIFEEKARASMDYLWQQRHRSSDLMGTVLNIHNGDWIRRDSGVGAGIDSYYEYCLKAYILLGDDVYLDRFNKHYSAVMKYVSQGPLLIDVHMHRPHTNSRNFMDALLAFWPGLQVLKGDIKPAIETHEMLYQVMQRHNFLPEAFTVDFQVHWGQHPLRPEFVESTYFLYKATNDPYYLEVGKKVLDSLQNFARVPCGFAAVKDVRTGSHEDRMDSFVLAETLKYLYLLFANKEELTLEVDDFVFTTEAHLLPLSLARINTSFIETLPKLEESAAEDHAHSCPNTHLLSPEGRNFAQTIRSPLKNLVEEVCPTHRAPSRTLFGYDFSAVNKKHLQLVSQMGITLKRVEEGKLQIMHNYSRAENKERAREGVIFIQELVEHTRSNYYIGEDFSVIYLEEFLTLYFYTDPKRKKFLQACPAKFGLDVRNVPAVEGKLRIARPFLSCSELQNSQELRGNIAVVKRGSCMFIEKAGYIENSGAIGGIVLDDSFETSMRDSKAFSMDGHGQDNISIPMVFLFGEEADLLLKALEENPDTTFGITDLNILHTENLEDPRDRSRSQPQEDPLQPLGTGSYTEVEFVDSTPSPKSAEEPKKQQTVVVTAQMRVKLLMQKLQNMLQIKSEFDQLLAQSRKLSRRSSELKKNTNSKAPNQSDLSSTLESLMRQEKMLDIDQDVEVIMASLQELVEHQHTSLQKRLCLGRSCRSPRYNRSAFLRYICSTTQDTLHLDGCLEDLETEEDSRTEIERIRRIVSKWRGV